MKEINYIVDQPLPITQDFQSLKSEGLDHIQKVTGNEWTNLNSSDPGITILDQLCFALTELGYCNNFTIKDILTGSDDKLIIKDQFYLPQEIFTTSPVTINDYIKYIIDEIVEVENVVIIPQQSNFSYIKGIYVLYLSIVPTITQIEIIDTICQSVFYRLNKRRNIGELFMMPMPLQITSYFLNGVIEITNAIDANKTVKIIQNKIREYIFPKVIQEDDEQLFNDKVTIDEVYNGPELRHGWVTDENLGKKKNSVSVRELINIIQSVAGVKSISNLTIEAPNYTDLVTSTDSQLLAFDLSKLTITCNSSKSGVLSASTLRNNNEQELLSEKAFGISSNKQTVLPKGKYRDINTYFSIQNTFPEIYAVGENAINSNASDFQIAQSRQLKGYLTLFDQVLANQFSQLANINQLFSFKNGLCGAPSEMQNFYALKSKYEKTQSEYPVPFLTFSPTYYYQSLYDVPNIRPLLKNNEAFNFSITKQSKKEAEENSWKQFKQDPYNSYIRGLQDMVENEAINLERRNEMLDHLLARHGESPLLINTIIEGAVYSGNNQKDKVIIKSLYLQNLGLLSYYRYKGYNYLGAKKINKCIELTPSLVQLLSKETTVSLYLKIDSYLKSENDQLQQINKAIPYDFENDFVFNSVEVDRIEKIKIQDFINYTALELQLNIFLGLKMAYIYHLKDLMDTTSDKKCDSCSSTTSNTEVCTHGITSLQKTEQIQQSLWFLNERKGFICIENSLLYPIDTTIIVTTSITTGPYYEVIQPLSYNETTTLYSMLEKAQTIAIIKIKKEEDQDVSVKAMMMIDNKTAYEVQEVVGIEKEIYWTPSTSEANYFFALHKSTAVVKEQDHTTLTLIFPDYIPSFTTIDFSNRLDLLLTNTLPVEVSYTIQFVSQEKLSNLIPAYIDWHNSLIFNHLENSENVSLLKKAIEALLDSSNSLNTVKQ